MGHCTLSVRKEPFLPTLELSWGFWSSSSSSFLLPWQRAAWLWMKLRPKLRLHSGHWTSLVWLASAAEAAPGGAGFLLPEAPSTGLVAADAVVLVVVVGRNGAGVDAADPDLESGLGLPSVEADFLCGIGLLDAEPRGLLDAAAAFRRRLLTVGCR